MSATVIPARIVSHPGVVVTVFLFNGHSVEVPMDERDWTVAGAARIAMEVAKHHEDQAEP